METIIYQGQPVQATRVNYLSGSIPTSTVDMDGDEELFRDEAGRYYLRRQLNWLDDESTRKASGRTHVHRLNLNAAILWATTRLNSETLDLRCDAASLLMEGRGYHDPAPTPTMRRVSELASAGTKLVRVEDGPLSSVTTDGWFDGCIQPEAGSGARVRTIFDLDPLHAALLKRFTESHGINVAVLARAALTRVPSGYRRRATRSDFWLACGAVFPKRTHRFCGKEEGETNHAERWFGTVRARLGRLVRRADSFSKSVERHLDAIHLFITTYNLEIQQKSTAS